MPWRKRGWGVSKFPSEDFPLSSRTLFPLFPLPTFPMEIIFSIAYFSPWTWFSSKVNENTHARAAFYWTSQRPTLNNASVSQGYQLWRSETSEGLTKLMDYKLYTCIYSNHFQLDFQRKVGGGGTINLRFKYNLCRNSSKHFKRL